MCGLWSLLRPGGPWSVTWGPEAPDSSCGGLIRLAGPWYVLRGPDSLCGALVPPAAPWFLPRRPHPSRGALLVPRGPDSSCGPWFDVRGPDPSCGAPIRIVRPWSVPWFLICPTELWFILQALICLAGPWFVLRVHPAGPGFVLGHSMTDRPSHNTLHLRFWRNCIQMIIYIADSRCVIFRTTSKIVRKL